MNSNFRFFFLAYCCLLLLTSACGKKNDPLPQDQKNVFAWEKATAMFTPNGCLAISAIMTGATRNIDGFSLELEPLAVALDANLPPELRKEEDTCEGCPFVPRESEELTPQEVIPLEKGKTRYAFIYCPQTKTTAFRWRLVARNVFMAFPYALTPVQVLR